MSSTRKIKRPWGVTLLCVAVLIVAGMNLARLAQAVREWQYLEKLLPISPAYLAVTGLVWGALGLLAAWRMGQGQAWARWFGLAYIVAFSAYYWIDRLFLPGYPGRNSNWAFSAGLNLFLIVWSVFTLIQPKAKQFFEANNDRRVKNSTTA